MTAAARIVHSAPGRLRLRIRQMRGDREFFDRLRRELEAQLPGGTFRVNSQTGSVLVTGGRDIAAEVGRIGRERGWFDLQAAAGPGTGPAVLAGELPTPFAGIAGDPKRLLITVLLTLAAVQLLRGRVLVPAASLLWYAYAVESDLLSPRTTRQEPAP